MKSVLTGRWCGEANASPDVQVGGAVGIALVDGVAKIHLQRGSIVGRSLTGSELILVTSFEMFSERISITAWPAEAEASQSEGNEHVHGGCGRRSILRYENFRASYVQHLLRAIARHHCRGHAVRGPFEASSLTSRGRSAFVLVTGEQSRDWTTPQVHKIRWWCQPVPFEDRSKESLIA